MMHTDLDVQRAEYYADRLNDALNKLEPNDGTGEDSLSWQEYQRARRIILSVEGPHFDKPDEQYIETHLSPEDAKLYARAYTLAAGDTDSARVANICRAALAYWERPHAYQQGYVDALRKYAAHYLPSTREKLEAEVWTTAAPVTSTTAPVASKSA